MEGQDVLLAGRPPTTRDKSAHSVCVCACAQNVSVCLSVCLCVCVLISSLFVCVKMHVVPVATSLRQSVCAVTSPLYNSIRTVEPISL